ncbi:hypothetical protein J7E96_31020 [Streptomyces sp. ISL-96]|uniref:hypothetical protein n=1 Tax=Streptomyces sp. ISL-96 TaxID=2819191 RepID=UPI001BE5013C|nr:hypothetical protein [Streptomyces sp. ISL-96]MBT2492864.1 hypothetical protein [Streptomyces sp. ISL-96]
MTPSVPHQSPSPDDAGKPTETHRHMVRRRWLTAIIIVLLIGIPAGYLLISAEQSRDSGRDKAKIASATGLIEGFPSRMTRRIYDVPVPNAGQEVAYYETNNWKSSRLYVQFRTVPPDLDWFLNDLGINRAALKKGKITISARDAEVAGWNLDPARTWSGTTVDQKDPQPTVDITVEDTDPARPFVYVVSTATP